MIQNPILKGFCPDPSIIRVGEDYYIATSTFEWWPGVKLFHSKDLKNWEQLPSPLRRYSQLDLTGDPASGGVWAPCLSYDGRYYYLVYTDVKTKKGKFYNTHNYMVYTEDIYGEWSEPVYLNSIGFDPSLFHDTDGKKYLINMVNGFKGILVQELEPGTWKLKGERKKVYDGSGIGCTEGPHMYHIGAWYYLLTAEGGTGYDHCVTMARAKSVWGPFETAPENPILTSDGAKPRMLQKCGHADIVDTPEGQWYMVHLCARPLNDTNWCTLGRETAIQKMKWDEDGWLRLEAGGRYASVEVPEPLRESEQKSAQEAYEVSGRGAEPQELSFCDDFEGEKLSVRYSSPRRSYEEFADCSARKGYLRIVGQESLNSLHRVSLLATPQRTVCVQAETAMEFAPEYQEQLAGLVYFYDAMNFYLIGKTVDAEGQSVLTLLKSAQGVITEEAVPAALPENGEVKLRAEVAKDGKEVCFYYQTKAEAWKQVGGAFTTEILTDEYCRGFTGAHFGLYVHDMTGLRKYADFDYMKIEGGKSVD